MESLKFAKFVHFFKKNGQIAVFHALSRDVIYTSKKELNLIKQCISSGNCPSSLPLEVMNKTIDYLKEKGFLVDLETNEDQEMKKVQQSILARPCIDTLYILLTDNCNFGCTYCFFEGSYPQGKKEYTVMTQETMINSILKFAAYLKKAYEFSDFKPIGLSLVFYGGEPLLNKNIFISAVEKIKELKKSKILPDNLTMNINTNGSLIDSEIASFCAKHNIEVDVSIDGYKSAHDACRIWKNTNQGTFDDVVAGIRILQKAGANVCVSCTVTKNNVDELPKIMEWFLDELGISNIGFNPLLDSYAYKVEDLNYSQKIADSLIECYKIARARGIYEARMMRKIKAFVNKEIYDRDCCGCGKQIVVCPDGSFGVCHAYSGTGKFFITPDEQFDPYNHPFWQEWSKRSPLNISDCAECEAITFCGGGCSHNADILNGSIWNIDKGFCIHAKKTLEWLIWDLHEKIA